MPPLTAYSGGLLLGGRDVVVDAEEVGRVVAGLDLPQAVPGRARVGRAVSCLAFVADEVDVHAIVPLVQRRREVCDPLLMPRCLVGIIVERGDVPHDAVAAVSIGGCLG